MADHRISQGVVEALAEGSKAVRTSQAVVEVLAGPATTRRVSQAAVEILVPNYPDNGGGSGGTNPPAAALPSVTPQFFGIREEIDDGTILEAFSEAAGGPLNGPAAWFGTGDKPARILSFGSLTRKVTTPGGGLQASVQQLILDDTDRYFRAAWDATIRRGTKWSNYTVDHTVRLAAGQPFRLSAGMITDGEPLDQLTWGLTVEGMLGRHITRPDAETKVPPNLITPAENPILADRFQDGFAPAIGYGYLDDELAAKPQGVVPGYYVGSANLQAVFGGGAINRVGDFYVFFGHAVQDTLNLYVTPAAWTATTQFLVGDRIRPNVTSNGFLYQCTTPGISGSTAPTFSTTVGATFTDGGVTWQNIGADDPELRHVVPSSAYGQILIDPHKPGWTAATGTLNKYLDFNGYRYHVVIFDNVHRFAKALREGRIQLTGNFRGIEDVGDGTGALISAPARIYQHFWTNFVENTYKTGTWFPVPAFGSYSVFDTTTIDTVTTYTSTLVSGGPVKPAILIGEGGKQVPVFDPVKWMAASWDLKIYENRHGQICTAMRNPAAAVAATFKAQHDIIRLTPSPRKQEYANVVRYRYGPLYAPPVATQLEGAEGQPMPASPVNPHREWASGLKQLPTSGTADGFPPVYLDLDLPGVRDQATADMYAARALARAQGPAGEGPVSLALVTGLQGLAVDCDAKIAVDHAVEGLGPTGFVAAEMFVDEIAVDPDTAAVTLTCDLV